MPTEAKLTTIEETFVSELAELTGTKDEGLACKVICNVADRVRVDRIGEVRERGQLLHSTFGRYRDLISRRKRG